MSLRNRPQPETDTGEEVELRVNFPSEKVGEGFLCDIVFEGEEVTRIARLTEEECEFLATELTENLLALELLRNTLGL